MEAMLLPHDVESERGLLGAMLQHKSAAEKAIELLGTQGEAFYDPAFSVLYAAIIQLHDRGLVPDRAMLASFLAGQEALIQGMTLLDVVGGEKLDQIFSDHYSPANAEYYAEKIHKLHVQRRIIRAAGDLARMGANNGAETAGELISRAESLVYNLRANQADSRLVDARAASLEFWAMLQRQIEDPDHNRGWKLASPTWTVCWATWTPAA